ncbi:hypothetical protein ES703_98452 [subsurface metagenome]
MDQHGIDVLHEHEAGAAQQAGRERSPNTPEQHEASESGEDEVQQEYPENRQTDGCKNPGDEFGQVQTGGSGKGVQGGHAGEDPRLPEGQFPGLFLEVIEGSSNRRRRQRIGSGKDVSA